MNLSVTVKEVSVVPKSTSRKKKRPERGRLAAFRCRLS